MRLIDADALLMGVDGNISKEIKAMTTEELKELAKQKDRNGNASSDALKAQKELIARNGEVAGHHRDGLYHLSDVMPHSGFVKKFRCTEIFK